MSPMWAESSAAWWPGELVSGMKTFLLYRYVDERGSGRVCSETCRSAAQRFWKLFHDADLPGPLPHFGPNLVRLDAALMPEHDQVAAWVGAFPHGDAGPFANRIEGRPGRFLDNFLRLLAQATR